MDLSELALELRNRREALQNKYKLPDPPLTFGKLENLSMEPDHYGGFVPYESFNDPPITEEDVDAEVRKICEEN